MIAVDPVTGAQTVLSQGGSLSTPFGIAVDAAGRILVADTSAAFGGDGQGAVIAVDPVTGAQTILSRADNFINPSGIAVVPEQAAVVPEPASLLPFAAAHTRS